MYRAAASFAFLLALAVHAAASSIVPAEPAAFQPVSLRTAVDGCVFVPSTVRVEMAANVLRVTQHTNNCIVPGPLRIVDIRLGTFPAGDYRVEVHATPDASGTPMETLAFQVRELPEIAAAIFPPPPRPIADYSGMWWNPRESGWGLSIHQGYTNLVFATWFVYGATGQPEWFTIQGGRWTDSTTWSGPVYRTTGPFYGAAAYDPALVNVATVGEAAIEFSGVPADGTARFTYTVSGVTASKTITRIAF